MNPRWDTPDFWTRNEVDQVLREMEDDEPANVADTLERNRASYDGDPAIVDRMVAELRRRAAAGVRFWPGPRSIDTA